MRDTQNRPITILNLRKAVDEGLTSMDDFLDVVDGLLAYSIQHALVPGQIETLTYIIDVKDVAVYELPLGSLLHMTKRLKHGYKLRTYKVLIVNVHWIVSAAAQILFTFLPSHIAEKVSMQSGNGSKDLLKYVDPNNLEIKYGGNLPNKETDFFPPRYNP